jgi:predicted porin
MNARSRVLRAMRQCAIYAAAIGGLCLSSAVFAQSAVEIYGRAYVGLDNWSALGATAGSAQDYKSRMRVYDNRSRLGFRGSEDLGGGLKAIFQVETGVNMDSGSGNGQDGTANASSGFLASRDSYAGLAGSWGAFRFGRQTIYQPNGSNEQTDLNYVNTGVPYFQGLFGRIARPATRQSNVAQYLSPDWNGFALALAYAPNSEAATAGQQTDGKVWNIKMTYKGPVNVQVDYSKNISQSATTGPTIPGTRTGLKASIAWPYAPAAQITLLLANQKRDSASAVAGFTAAGDNVNQNMWGLNWEHTFGNIQALAQYGTLDKISGCTESAGAAAGIRGSTCAETESTSYLIGARYLFSKRTAVYTTYMRVLNHANQNADSSAAGYSSASTLPAGADPTVWALGIVHNF